MILWMILNVLTALAVVGLTIPLVRRHDLGQARETGIVILQHQLKDIDAQEASGTLGAGEAEGMRNEVRRRMLAEGRTSEAAAQPLGRRTLAFVAVATAGVVAISATALYVFLGHPQPPAAVATTPDNASAHPVGDVATMIGELEARLRANPNDAEGWRMLGWSYSSVNRPADAASAYARAASIDPTNAQYPSAEGDALVNAAHGQVTPDALTAFQTALKIDPADPRARYYMALYEDQLGQHDQAVADWIALLKSAPSGAEWARQVRDFVERIARERHIDLSGKLPAQDVAQPGPTSDQVAAAEKMSPGDREAMINAMVEKLANELKANPQNMDGWMKLMRVRMVLGQTDKAASAYHDALRAFAGAPAELDAIKKAAQALGVPGA